MGDEEEWVRPNGLAIRRMRHQRSWSTRQLGNAIAEANWVSAGLRETIAPQKLSAIEEREERIPYSDLLLIAGGFDCDPIDILSDEPEPPEDEAEGSSALDRTTPFL